MSQRKKCEHCKTKNKLANNDFSCKISFMLVCTKKKVKNCVEPKIDVGFFWLFFSQESCSEVIFSNDTPFKRLDHYKLHEYTRKWNFSSANNEPVTMTLTNSIDAMFKRKRGRPPKNRVIEVRTDFFKGFFFHAILGRLKGQKVADQNFLMFTVYH